jgi:hypothetical protein
MGQKIHTMCNQFIESPAPVMVCQPVKSVVKARVLVSSGNPGFLPGSCPNASGVGEAFLATSLGPWVSWSFRVLSTGESTWMLTRRTVVKAVTEFKNNTAKSISVSRRAREARPVGILFSGARFLSR